MKLDSNYWEEKYKEENIGWDIGDISTPLKEYFDQLADKNLKILIPGCGNSYEAEYLFSIGFKNVFIIDWSETALYNFKSRVKTFPVTNLFQEDFFLHIGKYDIIIEQTFFCSIKPEIRANYAKKVFDLLNEGGKLVGLLFDDELNSDKPPYGGRKHDYVKYFSPYFDFRVYETAYNSIKPRAGREIFVNFVKKII